jgi:hypothetical protein
MVWSGKVPARATVILFTTQPVFMSFIIDDSGTILNASDCYFVDGDIPDHLDGDDSGTSEFAQENGVPVRASLYLLNSIADALWGEDADADWGADTLEAIADAIRTLRPDLARE